MEKIITFVVPCFNSSAYMSKCIDLLVQVGEDIEVIIVDDGSTKDNTYELAKGYEEKYPNIVKAIHQENKGHGGALNTGLANASGKYFKVIDSDDWANTEDILTLLKHIKNNTVDVDLYITNYVYEKVYENTSHRVTYEKYLKPETILSWEETKPFPPLSPMLMHALVYKTSILRDEAKLELPEHTFYVDNIFAYSPLCKVKTLYYVNIDLYHYFIGRSDQSVTTENMYKRYEQQSLVFTRMFKSISYQTLKSLPKRQKDYLIHDLKQIYAVTSFFVICGKDNIKQRKLKWKEMMKDYKNHDKKLLHILKFQSYTSYVSWLPWPIKASIGRFAYKILTKKLKLGA